ncbi:hypothetical protein EYF80_026600 [Liparis tanakae]|uniref:Uncharacterized protein n=1 Tax=Liparis tanakae TaxID=230148 RepID=A0A4Z2HBJ8_9TELE|nr:hypothetical protein EYF80_026600 [Liparis tanakae]
MDHTSSMASSNKDLEPLLKLINTTTGGANLPPCSPTWSHLYTPHLYTPHLYRYHPSVKEL